MNKIFCTLILLVLVLAGCITATPFNDESASKGWMNLRNSVDDERMNEIWYRMSYVIRDEYNFKFFVDNWSEIKGKLRGILDGQVVGKKEIETEDKMQGVVLKMKDGARIVELLFVAELDKERFPSETEVVWRFRGIYKSKDKSLSYGFLPKLDE